MSNTRHPVTFTCEGETLVGIVTCPPQTAQRGMLIIVGGPQYRVGSHRQFALLADRLAAQHGIAVMRFDYRGMGDSSGELRGFEHAAKDVRAAIDAFFALVHGLREVVLWGLCDGASASLLYAPQDPRVSGVALLNPWVRSAQTEAAARLKHYYWTRLWSGEAWGRIVSGRVDLRASIRSLSDSVAGAVAGGRDTPRGAALHERMADALARFHGRVLIILAGQDLTAQEFVDVTEKSRQWQRLLASSHVTQRELPEATHTFSTREWRDQVAVWTAKWMQSW